jgi:murein DD-endopeptidase MepM/ murein hydrolase activator NlpD
MPQLHLVRCGVPLAAVFTLATGPAMAHTRHIEPERPQVSTLTCVSTAGPSCTTGDSLHIDGEGLHTAKRVVFLGERGRADDRRAVPRSRNVHAVTVIVPPDARSGPVRVTAASGRNSLAKPEMTIVNSRPLGVDGGGAKAAAVFPVGGEHSYGTAANGFGGARNHQGQDIFAACGTPVLAAMPGTVTKATFEARAGNYAVLRAEDGTSHVYMHMQSPAAVTEGQQVVGGQPVGAVGQTGRASGCHLHFELWTAPGWYPGGRAVDPLSQLRNWDTQLTHS